MDERASEPLPQDTPEHATGPGYGRKWRNGSGESSCFLARRRKLPILPEAADGDVALGVTDLLYAE